MEISQSPAAQPGASPSPQRGGVISTDFDTFLKMLTTQMQNQDPLNPMDSGQLAVQLATFSGVEQQVLTNDLLSALKAQGQAASMGDYAGWIGMQARVEADAMFDGTPVTVVPQPQAGADRARLVVFDAQGAEVQWIDLTDMNAPYDWAGTGPTGAQMPAGRYGFAIDSYEGETYLGREDAQVYARVTEVRAENSGTVAVLASGQTVPVSDVKALREAR
ncbi:flagellar hook capping FlgD N-terminal domain-containing protein [Actibacterium sp. XHP0104]|uniref:flagellar hook capping FlgD N-terminal domain-containing protein n=1 Tax=Actibacterium sp. XHP0104 TaxID=2984335 RepID=UPI0021E77ADD|nr:flagellar hook capping FlgD N-terminal domain-containing protein [Actibacterium sp. XHP0104]MCV2881790.1 flagellar hook assembly protein FlgD [Actibacterium sp. XHP0104]